MKIYFITGISGSGKTTVARVLRSLGYIAFDSKINKGIFHFADRDGNEPKEFLLNNEVWNEQYKWVLNKPMFDMLLEQYKDKPEIFLCGTGNIIQYRKLANKIFLLKVDRKTVIERLNNPTRDNRFGKDGDTQKLIVEKLDWIQNTLLNAGAIAIDSTKEIDVVVDKILAYTRIQ